MKRRWIPAAAGGVGVLAIAMVAAAGRDDRVSLERSVGASVFVHLRAENFADGEGAATHGGVKQVRTTIVGLDGRLTGVSDQAITVETADKVFWVPVDRIHAVEFVRR